MESQPRNSRASVRQVLHEDEILVRLNESEGDFSASDDDGEYEPSEHLHRPSDSSTEDLTEESEDDLQSSQSPALSVSSLTRGRRTSRAGRRGQPSQRLSRARVRRRGQNAPAVTTAINSWTEVFDPLIHSMHSPNYVPNNFANYDMFEYFNQYIDHDLLQEIVDATNQTEMLKNHKNLGLTMKELKVFLGINMVMASIGYPKIRMFWEKATRVPIVADNLTRDRFFILRTRLKIVFDNDVSQSQRENDKIWKVRPLFDRVCKGCHAQVKSEHLSIDEMIIPFSGQCSIRQYCPNKPNPVGLKVFVLANPSGCICDMKIYEGATTFPENEGFNLGESAILHLTKSLVPGHYLYFDRYFSTKRLMTELSDRGFNATGTIMKNRVPRDCVTTPDKEFMKKERGSTEVLCSEDGKLAITKWLDNKPVLLISTCQANGTQYMCKRWDKRVKRYVQVPRPEVIKMYNSNMGGVDLADRMIAVCPIRARTRKWTIRFIFHMIDIAISNSWLTYRHRRLHEGIVMHKIPQLREYKLKLGYQLIEENIVTPDEEEGFEKECLDLSSQHKKRRVEIKPLPILQRRTTNARHMPVFTKKQQRCRKEGCSNRTTAKCSSCDVYLCLQSSRNCFAQFHGHSPGSE